MTAARSRKHQPSLEALQQAPVRRPVSVIITTFNEEWNIAACIESVLWADEIFLEGMEVLKVPGWQRYLIYFGVRLGGWYAWRKNRRMVP